MTKKQINKSGFTVIEMILYMGLLSGLLIAITDIFLSSLNVKIGSEATSSLEQDGRYIISRLTYDIHRAQNIVSPSSLGATADALTLTVGGSPYLYSTLARNMWLQDNIDTQRLNGNKTDITFFSVTRLGNDPVLYPNDKSPKDTLQIVFTLVATASSGLETRTFQTTVGLR